MRSHLGGYSFAALTLLALYADMGGVALLCGIATALTWKGHRTR
ncbi:hypothetical protein ACIBI8_37070 [Streptomyces sp. NPDC050529]